MKLETHTKKLSESVDTGIGSVAIITGKAGEGKTTELLRTAIMASKYPGMRVTFLSRESGVEAMSMRMNEIASHQGLLVSPNHLVIHQVDIMSSIESLITDYSDSNLLVIDGPNKIDSINRLVDIVTELGIGLVLSKQEIGSSHVVTGKIS
jgi:predicted ATP-dependent serine protease